MHEAQQPRGAAGELSAVRSLPAGLGERVRGVVEQARRRPPARDRSPCAVPARRRRRARTGCPPMGEAGRRARSPRASRSAAWSAGQSATARRGARVEPPAPAAVRRDEAQAERCGGGRRGAGQAARSWPVEHHDGGAVRRPEQEVAQASGRRRARASRSRSGRCCDGVSQGLSVTELRHIVTTRCHEPARVSHRRGAPVGSSRRRGACCLTPPVRRPDRSTPSCPRPGWHARSSTATTPTSPSSPPDLLPDADAPLDRPHPPAIEGPPREHRPRDRRGARRDLRRRTARCCSAIDDAARHDAAVAAHLDTALAGPRALIERLLAGAPHPRPTRRRPRACSWPRTAATCSTRSAAAGRGAVSAAPRPRRCSRCGNDCSPEPSGASRAGPSRRPSGGRSSRRRRSTR